MPIALQKECECRAPPRTAATGRQTKSKLASEFGEADFAFYYHIKTSPTASGKGLRRLAQCVWMAGCDCGVVVFFLDSVVMWNTFWRKFLLSIHLVAIQNHRQ